jgi:hypothetical protein
MNQKVEELKRGATDAGNGIEFRKICATLAVLEQLQENEKNAERRHVELMDRLHKIHWDSIT